MRLLRFAILVGTLLSVVRAAYAAPSFPFHVSRGSDGRIERIEVATGPSLLAAPAIAASEVDDLELLREAYDSVQSQGFAPSSEEDEYSGLDITNEEERRAFEQAKAFMAHGFSRSDLHDPRLDGEFAKAKQKLSDAYSYTLLAAPYAPGAFDQERAITAATKGVLEAAKLVLDTIPVFSVFEFLIDQHLESLSSRRTFHQNRLLVWLDLHPGTFTPAETAHIRSSVHYSRIAIYNIPKRDSARARWATYGNEKSRETLQKCSGFASRSEFSFHPCFKIKENKIRNRLVDKSIFSDKSSVAFDYRDANHVRNIRKFWMLTRLGLKFVPAPGPIKFAVTRYIDSRYKDQRKTEGYLYESARLSGQTDLAAWVIYGSANPMLR